MNFLRFEGTAAAGAGTITLGDHAQTLPQLQEPAAGALVLGVRPEHVALSDTAPLRGRIEATEYLGTNQIVTLSTPFGPVKARTPSTTPARPGDLTGLLLNAPRLALFDATTGRALRTAANAGVHHG